MTRRRQDRTADHQAGFTLIELMVAMFTGLLLMAGVFTILYQTVGLSESLVGQVALNQHSREMFHMLADGGYSLDGSANFPGFRGVNTDYAVTAANLRYQNRLCLRHQTSFDEPESNAVACSGNEALELQSSTIDSTEVTCTDTDQPVEGCTAVASDTEPMTGHLARTPGVWQDTTTNTLVFKIDLILPYQTKLKYATGYDYQGSYIMGIGVNMDDEND